MASFFGTSRKSSVVAVAQLVESRIVIPVVVGSSPMGHPNRFKQKAHLVEVGFLLLASGKSVGSLHSPADKARNRSSRHTLCMPSPSWRPPDASRSNYSWRLHARHSPFPDRSRITGIRAANLSADSKR